MLNDDYLRSRIKKICPSAKIFIYEETDSTNTRGLEYAKSAKTSAPAIFIAESQSGGRGRRGRRFVSEKGAGLYLSILMFDCTHADIPSITAGCAVRMSRAIERAAGLKTEIKWVNDLYAKASDKRKKICGILAEGQTSLDGKSTRIVCGMGINVYKNAVSDEIKDIATSIEESSGKAISIEELAVLAVDEFFKEYSCEELICEYRSKSMVIGKAVEVIPFAAESYKAEAVAVSDDYSLLVRLSDGSTRTVYTGEVSLRLE